MSGENPIVPLQTEGIDRTSALHTLLSTAPVDSLNSRTTTVTASSTVSPTTRTAAECAMYAVTKFAKETIKATMVTVGGDPIALAKMNGNDETVETGCSALKPTVHTW